MRIEQQGYLLGAELKQQTEVGNSLTLSYLAAGADSRVFLVESRGQNPSVLKLYDKSVLNTHHIRQYQEYTNTMHEHLKEKPYVQTVTLDDTPYAIDVAVNPIHDVFSLDDGTPAALSPFISGSNMYDLTITLANNRPLTLAQTQQIGNPSHFLQFYDEYYKISLLNGFENEYNRYMNRVLDTKYICLQRLNIIPHAVAENHIRLIITDIEGVIHETPEIMSG